MVWQPAPDAPQPAVEEPVWLVAMALCLAVWQSAHVLVPLFQLFLTIAAELGAMVPVVVLWQPAVLPA